MPAISILSACGVAFVAVFVLLSFLALVMHVLTLTFPQKQVRIDPMLIAAITSTVSSIYPGARVTRVEEKS